MSEPTPERQAEVLRIYSADLRERVSSLRAERDALAEKVVRLEAERDFYRQRSPSWLPSGAAIVGDEAVAKHREESNK